MSVDTDFRRLQEANPVPSLAMLREDELDVAALLAATQQRSTEMDTKEPITAEPKQKPPKRGWVIALAAVAIAVFIGLVALLPGEDESDVVDEPEPPTTPTVAVEEQAFGEAEALAIADAYFAAFNAGDVAGVMDLLAPDVWIVEPWGDSTGPEYELPLTFYTAQGTVLEGTECTPTEETGGDVTVRCLTDTRDANMQAANTGSPTTITFQFENGFISVMRLQYGSPQFADTGSVMMSWMEAAYPGEPDTELVTNIWGDNTTDAQRSGELTAQYAQEWVSSALGVISEANRAWNAGDLDGFLAHFAETAIIYNIVPDQALRDFGALIAANDVTVLESCAPAGVSTLGSDGGGSLVIECDLSATDDITGPAGVVFGGPVVYYVTHTGQILNTESTFEYDEYGGLFTAFASWMETAHPEAHAAIDWDSMGVDWPWPTAEDMPTAAAYVDEFVAQSDVYPLG